MVPLDYPIPVQHYWLQKSETVGRRGLNFIWGENIFLARDKIN